VTQFLAKYS